MIPALRKFLHSLLFDETAFVRWVRAFILTVGASGLAYADQIASIIGAPTAVERVKKAAVVCMGLSILIGAGDKTPEAVKQMARDNAAAALDGKPSTPSIDAPKAS